MNISKDVPYGTQCNGRKNFGDSMPGSLNYSPSESEGGRSRIGQADLDKGLVGIDFTVTPGTTPVKWRKGSGKAVPLVESSNTTVAKDPKSRGGSSAATRRNPRSDTHQTSPGEDPAPAERLARKPSTRESASTTTSWSDHARGILESKYMDGASGELESGHVTAKCGPDINGRGKAEAIGCDVRTELASAVCGDEGERGQIVRHHQGRVVDDEDGRLHLDKTNFNGRTLGATGSSNHINDCERGTFDARKEVPHGGGLINKGFNGDEDNGKGNGGNGDDGNDDGGNRDGGNADDGDGDNSGGDNHAIEQNKDDDRSKSWMATAREGHVEHRGIEAPVEGNGDLRWASEDPRERYALGDVVQTTTMQNRAPARVSSNDTCYNVKDDSWRLGTQKSDHGPSVNVGGASPGVACGGNPSPTCDEDQETSRSVEHTPDEVEGVLGVEAADKGANQVQGRSQHQHQRHPGGNPRATEQGMTALARSLAENRDKAAADYENKGVALEDSTLEFPSSGDVNDDGNAELHRDPQSPPVLSRRSACQLGGPSIGRRHSYEEYTARVNRASERRFSLEQSTPYRVALDESTPPKATGEERPPVSTLPGPHHSPTLLPSPVRPRSPQSISPQSPVVIAARAVSHDESVRSTLCMQRAAKAVAIEDERMHLDSLEFKKAKEDRTWCQRLKTRAPHRNAELERDQDLELTREVLRMKHAEKAQERVAGHRSKTGRRRRRSPPRKSKPSQDCHSYVARPIKDSVARSCGLSSTQLVLLRSSRELAEAKNTRKPDRQRTHRLAQPKAKRPATRRRDPATESLVKELTQGMSDKDKRAFLYACLADVKECTYSPHPRSSAQCKEGGNNRGDAENKKEQGEKEAFLYRVDAREKARNAAMEHRRGELMYNATLDKRVCPSCDIEQSYDEVQEGRKMCPNCDVEYRKPMTWAGVRKDFFKRMDTFEKSRRAFIEGAAKRQEKEIEMLALGCCDTRELERKKGERLYWEDIEGDFILRLQEDTARRQTSRETRLATIAGEEYTFQPNLSAASERFMRDSAWTEMTFLERLEADLQRRRDATFDERNVLMTDERL